MAGNREFDWRRFEALVLYIAHRRRDDQRFGRTKLAKALFYSDFEVYKESEVSITGATYVRMPHGPFPKELERAESSLEQRGFVHLDYVKEEYDEKRLLPMRPFPLAWGTLLEDVPLGVVDRWTDHVASASARRISELSHEHPGWLLAPENGAEIPYRTAILPLERPSMVQAERAKELARERGWLSPDGEWLWERDPA